MNMLFALLHSLVCTGIAATETWLSIRQGYRSFGAVPVFSYARVPTLARCALLCSLSVECSGADYRANNSTCVGIFWNGATPLLEPSTDNWVSIIDKGNNLQVVGRNCVDVKQRNPGATSGVYYLQTNIGPLQVYCDMEVGGGGFTFLRKRDITCGTRLNISEVRQNNSKVLLRYQDSNSLQRYTILEQLSRYAGVPLSLQICRHDEYTTPTNAHLGPYLYLGFLPISMMSVNMIQGFRSNGQDHKFSNCDSNFGSRFTFYSNVTTGAREKSTIRRFNLTSKWLASGRPLQVVANIPDGFVYFAEMQFGGCGTYWTTGETSADFYGIRIDGIAMGFF